MIQGRLERRLAAIFAADVAGYSRLMDRDEVGTLRALTAHRSVMDRLIEEHGGRIANTAGDSVLAEFPSAVDAVQCAVEVQKALAGLNEDIDPDRVLRFRIGVHIGDVMVRGGDLLGDGVNIAARLEGLAEPGGVCISGDVHRHVRKALPVSCTDLGPQKVKNIEEPIHSYAIRVQVNVPVETAPSSCASPKTLPLPDRPSIAVLPFTNMSSDLEQDYFCDGLTEEIITALSRFKALFVIARNSSFTYKSKAVDVRQIGRELGVRYVLEGSVRKLGHRVRITGQLIESATGTHIWAERYDGNLDDVFSLQDEITASVVAAVEPTVTAAEIARAKQKKTENLNAYDLYLRAMADTYDLRAATYERAEGLLRSAIEQDSNYSDALAALADCLARAALNGWKDFAPAVQEASEFARRSILAEPDNGRALAIAAWIYANLQGRHKEARELAERALRSHPNSSMVRALTGWALLYCGKIEAAMELFVASQRMNPVDPLVRIATNGIGAAHFFAREFQESVEWNERVLQTTPGSTVAMRYLAAALAHLGRVSEAKEIIARLLRSQPNSSLSRSRQSAFEHQWMLDLYLDGLRRAGLPE